MLILCCKRYILELSRGVITDAVEDAFKRLIEKTFLRRMRYAFSYYVVTVSFMIVII